MTERSAFPECRFAMKPGSEAGAISSPRTGGPAAQSPSVRFARASGAGTSGIEFASEIGTRVEQNSRSRAAGQGRLRYGRGSSRPCGPLGRHLVNATGYSATRRQRRLRFASPCALRRESHGERATRHPSQPGMGPIAQAPRGLRGQLWAWAGIGLAGAAVPSGKASRRTPEPEVRRNPQRHLGKPHPPSRIGSLPVWGCPFRTFRATTPDRSTLHFIGLVVFVHASGPSNDDPLLLQLARYSVSCGG